MISAEASAWFARFGPPPLPPSRLERIAYEAGVPPYVLRRWLRGEVERRRAAQRYAPRA